MAAPKVTNNEASREANAEEIKRWFEDKVQELADTLESSEIDFDMEKVSGEVNENYAAYRTNARSELDKILADAAAEEAKAKAGK